MPIIEKSKIKTTAERLEISEQIQRVLKCLTPKEETVIKMRFGIGIDRDHTLEEIGRHLSITRERVRQIEEKALRKIKHPSRLRILKKTIKLLLKGIGVDMKNKIHDEWILTIMNSNTYKECK